MGSVTRIWVTKRLPRGAKIVTEGGRQVAKWRNSTGKQQRADIVPGSDPPRIRQQSRTFYARYRDANGKRQCVRTGCRDEGMARRELARLEDHAEKIRVGVITEAEAKVASNADSPIDGHLEAYLAELACKRGKGGRPTVSAHHVRNQRHALRQAIEACNFRRLRDLGAAAVERWVVDLVNQSQQASDAVDGAVGAAKGLATRTINIRIVALKAWGGWLVEDGRLTTDPFARLRKLNEADGKRRQRRSYRTEQMVRLLGAAQLRPVAEYGRETVPTGKPRSGPASRATWRRADLTYENLQEAYEKGCRVLGEERRRQLDRLGLERMLMYWVMATTGLRKAELASITLADVRLEDSKPVIELRPWKAKNGKGKECPVHKDLLPELRKWVASKRDQARQGGKVTRQTGAALAAVRLFDVPSGLLRILNRDLTVAGIPKRDDRGRTVDVHALRHTLASSAAQSGVAPRTTQSLMGHSSIDTTMNSYTDTSVLDTSAAVDQLPSYRPAIGPRAQGAPGDAVQESRPVTAEFAPEFAPAAVVGADFESPAVARAADGADAPSPQKRRNRRKTIGLPATSGISPAGIEPATFSSGG